MKMTLTGLLETPEVSLAKSCLRRLADRADTLATAEIMALADCAEPEEWLTDRLRWLDGNGDAMAWGEADHPIIRRLLEMRAESALRSPVEIVASDADSGACRARCADQELRIPWCDRPVGTRLFVGLRADDVILTRSPPEGLSVRNALSGKVTEIAEVGAVRLVHVDVGRRLAVKVTPEAVGELGLAPGLPVFCLIKTHSLRLGPELD